MFNKPWKIIIAVAFISFVIYVIKESEKISLLNTFLPEKLVEFKGVHMSGIYGSSESWEIYAEQGWTSRDKFTTTFDLVTDARIEKNSRVMIKDLQARRVTMAKNKDIEIFREVKGDDANKYLFLYIDFAAASNPPKKERQFSSLYAKHIKFNPDTKQALIDGNIRIIKGKLVIRAENIKVDLDSNLATFEGRSMFKKEDSILYSNSAEALLNEDKIFLSGSVEAHQKGKVVRSQRGVYEDREKTITMSGGVNAEIEKLKVIMKKETAEKYESDEGEEALTSMTVLTCDNLTIFTEKKDANASGNVHVIQTGKEARSDNAFYSEKDETILLTGNAYMKRKDAWVKANKVIVSVDKETFEAIGGVETTFKVKKGSKRSQ